MNDNKNGHYLLIYKKKECKNYYSFSLFDHITK